MPTHLLILGQREGLAWVLANEQMAFRRHRPDETVPLGVGDELLLYTTRGCFKNPTCDRGRVIGRARVASPVRDLDPAPVIDGRTFEIGCRLRLEQLVPRGTGVVLADLVPGLKVFPDPRAWSAKLRRTILALPEEDAQTLKTELGETGAPRATARRAIASYSPTQLYK